ncbi:ATP-dependent DNA helicase RecG [Olsenella sp. SW781]|uniref:ATP-dependent DNA helicase RecG n=1 Tax=Olsenella sp. SW781 TaxID=2530046 RepID=UPI00143A84E2|nr:ATP-dependent DNA helicase RecG [Olsenella sp. SW781]NJE79733.1 ATP-dependent DNA helicase RecG [Olsenella sp. SW781]
MAARPSIPAAAERVQRTCALSDSVSRLRYVSGAREEALRRLGLARVRELMLHVPHRYLDFTRVTKIARADVGTDATIVATVDRVELKRPRPRMQIVELSVMDETGVLVATFFRQPWIAEQVRVGDRVALSGKVEFSYGFKRMKAPFHEVLGPAAGAGGYARVLPVHPVGEGVTASWMRRIVAAALADVGDVCDWLPAGLVARRGLMTLARALREVHFPTSVAAAGRARRRLAYDELLCLQLALLCRQSVELAGVEPVSHVTSGPHMDALLAALPFSLTDEQRAAADRVLADMAAPRVMNRLLLGDVGTGKTAVAAVALAAVADTGTQAAVMAPTSVLARQYAEKLGPVLDEARVSWALVTGSTPADERAIAEMAAARGELTVLFGTTALLSEGVEFAALSLAVIDEQHRFGVDQRAALRRKGAGADLLAMTATPIPRTLALSFYGDVELSEIRRRPRPGAGVETRLVTPDSLDLAWGAIREAAAAGHQAYVICPLVDDADDGAELDDVPEGLTSAAPRLRSATSTLADLRSHILPELSCDLLTGRMAAGEKDRAMERFRSGETQVLVSTTVVEVGVDVPNATVMVVLDADRFGLATLHQLRGRVGRGDVAGTVFLSSAAKRGSTARRRLSALERTSDGFELAELDLRLRHEGEVLGYRQHGGVTLRISDLEADRDLVEAAHADARAIADDDPRLRAPAHRAMALEVRDRFGAYFEELDRA